MIWLQQRQGLHNQLSEVSLQSISNVKPLNQASDEIIIGPCSYVASTIDKPSKYVVVRGLNTHCTAVDSIAPIFQSYGRVRIIIFSMNDNTRIALCLYSSIEEAKNAQMMNNGKTIIAIDGTPVTLITEFSLDPPHVEQDNK